MAEADVTDASGGEAAAEKQGRARLQTIIRERALLSGGRFTLASGRESSVFFDMKPAMLDPEGANLIADAVLDVIADRPADAVGGLVMGAVPIVAVVAAKSWTDPRFAQRPLAGFFVRKEAKDHGTAKRIDGTLAPGARTVILEDVTTSGASALQAADAVRAAGCTVEAVVTLVDRREGAAEAFRQAGLPFVAIFSRDDFL
jgi:orotate phosphoribosyltransferase